MESFLERLRRGERPAIEEYAARDPDLSDRIRALLPALALLEEAKRDRESVGKETSKYDEALAIGDLPPRRLGEYRLIGKLGQGGMGIVYEAEQSSLKRHVALKVLPYHALLEPRHRDRLRQEAQAAARLQHPHIVAVLGFGEEDGVPYFAMELVEGRDLQRVLNELRRLRGSSSSTLADEDQPDPMTTSVALNLLHGVIGAAPMEPGSDAPAGRSSDTACASSATPLLRNPLEEHVVFPPGPDCQPDGYYRRIANLGRQVADALWYAHERGVVHRDIKPSNLILDASGNVWVTDFGLVKAEGFESLTRSDELVGTLHYMAPERFRGLSGPQSDVYSLGMTLHELLTLTQVFESCDREELLHRILTEPPPDPRQIDPRIPSDLEAIVLKARAPSIEERYRNASDLSSDLARFLQGHSLLWKPSPPRRGARKLGGRLLGPPRGRSRLRPAILAGGAVVCLVLGVAGYVYYGSGGTPATTLAVGTLPQSVSTADVDGDGDQDMLVTNGRSGDVSVLLNRGRGAFEGAFSIQAGEGPHMVVAADLDGYAGLDLAVANLFSKDVAILKNGGGEAVRFEAASRIALGQKVVSIAAGDLDRDGHTDLVAVGGRRSVWILRNQGAAVFGEPLDLEAGGSPKEAALADLDRDGDLDALAVCAGASAADQDSVSILENRGDATFASPLNLALGPGAKANGFLVADLDGDGLADLAGARVRTGEVWVFWNLGGLTFSEATSLPVGSGVESVAAADFDGDSRVDLAAAGGLGEVWLFRGKGARAFEPPSHLSAGGKPTWVTTADLDGDGDPDVVVANSATNDLTLLFNEGGWFQGR